MNKVSSWSWNSMSPEDLNFPCGPENPWNLTVCQDKTELMGEIFAHVFSLNKHASPCFYEKKKRRHDYMYLCVFFFLSFSFNHKKV